MRNIKLSKFKLSTMSIKTIAIVIFCLLANASADDKARHHKREKIAKRQQLCGENEQFASSGIDCLTCENYQNTTCPTVYEKKCYCLDGFVSDYEGKCINTTQCATACRLNEHYVNTTPCEYKCGGWDKIPYNCNCNQTSGCVCDKGYVRCEMTNRCVPQDFCYPRCKANEVPSSSFCQPYCGNNTVVHPICPLYILPCKKYCACCQGYIRDGRNGICIPLGKCIGGTTSPEPVSTSTLA